MQIRMEIDHDNGGLFKVRCRASWRVSLPLAVSDAGTDARHIALFASVIGFLFWSHGVAELGPSRAGRFVQLMPVFGAALAFVFLGEPLSMAQIAGTELVLIGLLLIEER